MSQEFEVDQPDESRVEAEVAPAEFYFTMHATSTGVDNIEFVTDGPKVMQTLLLIAEQVNNSFEKKFENTSDFLQELTNLARNIEAIKNGQPSAAE